ncbi:MAG: translation initiation factor IF-5A [Nitrososphaerota archaeon]|jgi:translation initiation factor 5A|nr:translation initiation factor IF-5A [Nitrososphaerota archaeon]
MSKPVDLGSTKEGSYILIDGEPCRIVEYDKSKPGKHGAAKARVVGIGVFDGVKRSLVSPVSTNVEVPLIEKKSGQIISQSSGKVQIMDLETFETIDVPEPAEEEVKAKLTSGAEVEYWVAMGKMKIVRVKNA